MSRFLAVLWLALIALAAPATGQNFPANNGSPVVDQADILRPEQELDLKSKAEALYAQSGRAFAVATVKSLEGRTIEDYGYRLGRAWGLGQKGKDDGVILLVAPNEHKVRIEAGYGARVFLTDAVSSVIIREAILPHFIRKPPDYGGGIEEGADQIIKQMSLPPEEAAKTVAVAEQAQQKRQHSSSPLPAIFWFLIISFVLLSMMRRAGGRRYRSQRHGISPWVVLWGLNELSRGSRGGWGGSSWGGSGWGGGGGGSFGGGGGFGGFGGGSFGGGGASGSW